MKALRVERLLTPPSISRGTTRRTTHHRKVATLLGGVKDAKRERGSSSDATATNEFFPLFLSSSILIDASAAAEVDCN